jgi:histidine ammonia-lyase
MAAQGVELRAPLATSPRLQRALAAIRAVAAPVHADRVMSHDMEAAARLVREGRLDAPHADILGGMLVP